MNKHVMYLVSEPWYFVNHRLAHAVALLDAGWRVSVATRDGRRRDEAVTAGCTVHDFDMRRGGSPFSTAVEALRLRRLVRRERPDVVHAVALKPVALALGLFTLRRRPALILSINGLGISAVDASPTLILVRRLLRWAGARQRVELLFQTSADQSAVVGSDQLGTVIPGVGVDLNEFAVQPKPPTPPIRIVFLGRSVRSKGLTDLALAGDHPLLADVDIQIDAYCTDDTDSPGALTEAELSAVRSARAMNLHAATSNPAAVLAVAHAAILPSRAGEGVSKFVLEALATATPVLLSAESGSGEVITAGTQGLVFTGGDADSLASTIAEFATMSEEAREEMGQRGRTLAEARYGLGVILPAVVRLHESVTQKRRDT